jgi:hypothetical protein
MLIPKVKRVSKQINLFMGFSPAPFSLPLFLFPDDPVMDKSSI